MGAMMKLAHLARAGSRAHALRARPCGYAHRAPLRGAGVLLVDIYISPFYNLPPFIGSACLGGNIDIGSACKSLHFLAFCAFFYQI